MSDAESDQVIDFMPETGFVIEQLAASIVSMMREMDMGACVTLPDGIIIDIDKDCTEREIIKGYKAYMADRISAQTVSNKNEK